MLSQQFLAGIILVGKLGVAASRGVDRGCLAHQLGANLGVVGERRRHLSELVGKTPVPERVKLRPRKSSNSNFVIRRIIIIALINHSHNHNHNHNDTNPTNNHNLSV